MYKKITKCTKKLPNVQKNYQMYKKLPNGYKIYQHLPLQDPPKVTQIVNVGLKICHLATLFQLRFKVESLKSSFYSSLWPIPISVRRGSLRK
jgi:hypothetical protein